MGNVEDSDSNLPLTPERLPTDPVGTGVGNNNTSGISKATVNLFTCPKHNQTFSGNCKNCYKPICPKCDSEGYLATISTTKNHGHRREQFLKIESKFEGHMTKLQMLSEAINKRILDVANSAELECKKAELNRDSLCRIIDKYAKVERDHLQDGRFPKQNIPFLTEKQSFDFSFDIGGRVFCSASPSKCNCYGINTTTAVVNAASSFTLFCRNIQSVLSKVSPESIIIIFDNGRENMPFHLKNIDMGIYRIFFTIEVTQRFNVKIYIRGMPISHSPFTINIKPEIVYNFRNLSQKSIIRDVTDLHYDGICCTLDGDIILCSAVQHTIYVYHYDGRPRNDFGSCGTNDGELNSPRSICMDPSGRICVADEGNHRIQFFSMDGTYFDKFGNNDANYSKLNRPYSVAIDSKGFIAVADTATFFNGIPTYRFQVFNEHHKPIFSRSYMDAVIGNVYYSVKPSITFSQFFLEYPNQNYNKDIVHLLTLYRRLIYDNNGRLVAISRNGMSLVVLTGSSGRVETEIPLDRMNLDVTDFTIDPAGVFHTLTRGRVISLEFRNSRR